MRGLISTEAIAYQGVSKLALELTAVMQACIDHVAAEPTSSKKLAQVDKLCDLVSLQLPEIIERHTGIYIKNVVIVREPQFLFAMQMDLFNFATTVSTLERYSGYKVSPYYQKMLKLLSGSSVVSQDKIQQVSNQLDLTTGRFSAIDRKGTVPKPGQYYPPAVSGVLYFDIYSAFYVKETFHNQATGLTAQELTAIILHELGHMVTMIEHAYQKYLEFDMLHQASLDVINLARTDKTVRKNLRTQLETEDAKGHPAYKTSIQTLQNLEAIEDDGLLDSTWLYILNTVFDFCIIVLRCVYTTIVASSAVMNWAISTLEPLLHTSTAVKMSDTVGTLLDRATVERFADQYVAQHGYASYLVSALDKSCMLQSLNPHLFNSALKHNKFTYLLYQLSFFIESVLRADYPAGGDYEPRTRRLETLRQDLLQNMMHADALPKQMLVDLVADMDRLDTKLAQKSINTTIRGIIDSITEFLGNYTTPGALLAQIRNGNLVVEYTKLRKQIQRLIANPIYDSVSRLLLLDQNKK